MAVQVVTFALMAIKHVAGIELKFFSDFEHISSALLVDKEGFAG
ncbi:hypothetical protein SALWKB12_1905 [Snodgrassella communis]|nr:hypothetical protein SALWKB12_1905 [Snodgrassella communis]